MARFSAAFRSTGAGSATLPVGSLWATTTVRPRLLEIGVFNTVVTACVVALCRFSGASAGTKGAAITTVYESDSAQAALAACANTHTVTPTTISAAMRQAALGSAIGSGVIWTFGGGGMNSGLVIPNSATDGVGIIVATGTGQVLDLSFTWEE
jgi:hypothetical protein